MQASVLQPYVSLAEYLAREATAAEKHEWLDGVVRAMSGGTLEHSLLASRVIYTLTGIVGDRPCQVFTSDAMVRVEATGLCTYPDVSVVCGPVQRSAEYAHAMTNPVVLVEALSDSTEGYDRGEKFMHYRRIPSLQEYVLVSQRSPRVEVYRRTGSDRWELSEAVSGAKIALTSLGGELSVDEVYRGVDLTSGAP